MELMVSTMPVSTVSDGYREALLHGEVSPGRLTTLLNEARDEGRFHTVQNMIDLRKWNADDLGGPEGIVAGKLAAKQKLQARPIPLEGRPEQSVRLPNDPEAPLLAFIGRIATEKGLQHLLDESVPAAEGKIPATPLDLILQEFPRLQLVLGGKVADTISRRS